MQAMILAAGFGTRLRPYTELRPKPLFPVFDTPLLLILIEQLLQANCRKILVNCHYLAEQIMALLSTFPEVIILREERILGTGGALRQALPLMDDEPLLVINSDIVQNFDLHSLYHAHGRTDSPVSMVTHRYQRFANLKVNAEGQVVQIGQNCHNDGLPEKLAFTGVHIIEPAALERIPPGLFYGIIDLYRQFIAENIPPCSIQVKDHYWRDIGTVEDYLAVHADIIARPALFPALGPRLDSSGFVSASARVADSMLIEDWAVIGSGAEVGEGAVLGRCVVWDNARIPAFGRFHDTVIA